MHFAKSKENTHQMTFPGASIYFVLILDHLIQIKLNLTPPLYAHSALGCALLLKVQPKAKWTTNQFGGQNNHWFLVQDP